jgi:hypothetical protein
MSCAIHKTNTSSAFHTFIAILDKMRLPVRAAAKMSAPERLKNQLTKKNSPALKRLLADQFFFIIWCSTCVSPQGF